MIFWYPLIYEYNNRNCIRFGYSKQQNLRMYSAERSRLISLFNNKYLPWMHTNKLSNGQAMFFVKMCFAESDRDIF